MNRNCERNETPMPPVAYVAEKQREAVLILHSAYALSKRDLPDDIPKTRQMGGFHDLYNIKNDSVLSPIFSAFRVSLIGYVALNRMLEMVRGEDIFEYLLEMPSDAFRKWLAYVEAEGVC